MSDWEIAKIESVFLGFEDHGIFTLMIRLNFGGSSQGAGGYGYGTFNAAYSGDSLYRHLTGVMAVCDVREFSDIKGKTIMVQRDGPGLSAKIVALKPLPTEKGEEFRFED